MIRPKNSFALTAAITLAVLFLLGADLLYEWLLAAIVNAGPHPVSLIAAQPNDVFVHRVVTLAAFSFLGFAIGAALVACASRARTAAGLTVRYAGLALVGGGAVALCFAALRARVSAINDNVSAAGISSALQLSDVPLYLLGLLPGLCVFAYTAVLLCIVCRRGD
ncbi:hypothetical protein [Paraburkholderia sp. J7]|uniref:hypothetical protein n=1 Tax=Paraburkholderia sp. J7 TaxID=2805438 RepID=UPI002AB77F6E|nr:hypothetical protein [Paraburkholderia sp. J7]